MNTRKRHMNKGNDLFKNYIIDMYEDKDKKRQENMKEILTKVHQGKSEFDEKIEMISNNSKNGIDENDVTMLKEIYTELLDDSHSSLAEIMSIASFVIAVVAALISLVGTLSNFFESGFGVMCGVAGLITILLIAITIYSLVNLHKSKKVAKENTYFRNQKIYYIMLEHDKKGGNAKDNR